MSVTAAPSGGAEPLRSSLLPQMLEPLMRGEPMAMLDLGPSWASTFAYFGDFRCRLGVADALQSLAAMGAEGEDQPASERAGVWQEALLRPASGHWNAVLAWELFDYLPPALITEAGAQFAKILAPGSYLHTLTMSERSEIPRQPRHYELRGLDSVAVHQVGNDTIPAPRHGQSVLRRYLPGFAIEHSRLHRDGRQEHLLVYRG